MACSNCYNGCAEIVSDKCVKYTGPDVPALGILNGDSLSLIEASLIEFLTNALTGVSIKPIIDQTIICELVKKNLPNCGEFTLNDYLTALIKAVCDLQKQVDVLDGRVDKIEADYTIGCLTGVTASAGTHDILQAVITKLCAVSVDLAALTLNVTTNYVKLSELDSLIAQYLIENSASTKYYTKMVPYTAVEYYGTITGKFDSTGAGIGDWEKIYLCNGNNGTPDKRGRVPIGVTNGMGGGALNSAVDPSVAGNPSYSLNTTGGSNTVTLTENQIPAHKHTLTVTDPGHSHSIAYKPGQADQNESGVSGELVDLSGNKTSTLITGTKVTGITVSMTNTGGGGSHSNIQPVLACYYIMYIP